MVCFRSLVASLLLSVSPAASAQGYLEWRFGMSPDEVAAVEAYAPYTPIGTGDLETANGRFDGRRANVSFHFADTGLEKVQIWLYEGRDKTAALKGWAEADAYIRHRYGDTEALELGLESVASQDQLIAATHRWLGEASTREMVKLQLGPQTMPADAIVFSSLFRHPEHGYYVFLYYKRPPERQEEPAD